ncbi:MAG TPA: hypothetical protein VNR86_11185 [Sphingomicrobium sp.]|nr:hypothetical protein [Sphingomicrobium sp.]
MLDRWSEYFFMIGSSAAALIGLMFVVVTLTAGRDRGELERGKKLYTTPIVWHLGAVLVLSGVVLAPSATNKVLGIGALVIAVAGAIYAGRITVGILHAKVAPSFTRYDAIWYGIAPALAYCAIGVSGAGMLAGALFAPSAMAAGSMALLLISIHNEWDLVTFLAPTAPSSTSAADDKDPGE